MTNPRTSRLSSALTLPAFVVVCALTTLSACESNRSADDKSMQMAKSDDSYESMGRSVPSTKTLYSMSRILAKQDKDSECEVVLMELVTKHPDFLPAYADLSELYLRHRRVDSAIETLKAGVKMAPGDALLSNNLGMCYLLQGRNEEALESFTRAAAGTPKDVRARANMAVALGMMGRYDEALSVYLQVMPPADAHYNLGVLCDARKDAAGAAREFEIAETLRLGKKQPVASAPAPATRP